MSFRRSISDEAVQAAASIDSMAGQPHYQTIETVQKVAMFHRNAVKAVMTSCSTEFICQILFVLNDDMCVHNACVSSDLNYGTCGCSVCYCIVCFFKFW